MNLSEFATDYLLGLVKILQYIVELLDQTYHIPMFQFALCVDDVDWFHLLTF